MTDVPEDLAKDLFGFTAPSEEQLSTISVWATKALGLQAEIDQAEQHLKGLKGELQQIEERDLPTALLAAGTTEFTLIDGSQISIKDVIQGGFTKDPDKRNFIFDWVVKEGGQEIIKDHFEVDFTRGSFAEAIKLRELLRTHKVNFDEFENIHTQTFYAFLREKVKEKLEKQQLVPFEEMGLRFFKKAEIKPAK